MIHYGFTDHATGLDFVRVRADVARKVWRSGTDIIVCPCNLRPEPDSAWNPCIHILHESAGKWFDTGVFADFLDYYETTFAAYNYNSETGRYLAYYVPKYVTC